MHARIVYCYVILDAKGSIIRLTEIQIVRPSRVRDFISRVIWKRLWFNTREINHRSWKFNVYKMSSDSFDIDHAS